MLKLFNLQAAISRELHFAAGELLFLSFFRKLRKIHQIP